MADDDDADDHDDDDHSEGDEADNGSNDGPDEDQDDDDDDDGGEAPADWDQEKKQTRIRAWHSRNCNHASPKPQTLRRAP